MKSSQAKKIAEETLQAIEDNQYKNTSGQTITFDMQRSVVGSKLYKPDWTFDPAPTSLITSKLSV